MSYTIKQPNGTIITIIPDGTADGPDVNPGLNVTDINLIGHNYPSYGQIQNENFIRILQNFANSVPPGKPLPGELWYDTNLAILKIYTGSSFVPVTALVSSNTVPAQYQTGTQWWDTTNQQLKIYNGTDWTVIGPAYSILNGISGAIVENILDTANISHTVIKIYVNNLVTSIVSNDAAFTPLVPITGFTTINQGITLSTAHGGQIYGTATNSQYLGNVLSSNYARTDISSIFAANIAIGNGAFAVNYLPNGNVEITNTTLGGNIDLGTNINGIGTTALQVSGATGLITVAGAPTVSLGVATKGYVDSSISTAVAPLAPINSPTLTGVPTAPTAATGNVSTQIATTAFVNTAIGTSGTALWQGSTKYVNTTPGGTPDSNQGRPGDFWFQL